MILRLVSMVDRNSSLARRNSRMARPRERPSWGRFLGPNTSRAITKMRASSWRPMSNMGGRAQPPTIPPRESQPPGRAAIGAQHVRDVHALTEPSRGTRFSRRFLLHRLPAERIIRHSLASKNTEAHTMRRWTWMAAVAAMAASFLPPPVAAQTSDAVGIVTTIDGRATVARPALAEPARAQVQGRRVRARPHQHAGELPRARAAGRQGHPHGARALPGHDQRGAGPRGGHAPRRQGGPRRRQAADAPGRVHRDPHRRTRWPRCGAASCSSASPTGPRRPSAARATARTSTTPRRRRFRSRRDSARAMPRSPRPRQGEMNQAFNFRSSLPLNEGGEGVPGPRSEQGRTALAAWGRPVSGDRARELRRRPARRRRSRNGLRRHLRDHRGRSRAPAARRRAERLGSWDGGRAVGGGTGGPQLPS